MTATQIIGGLMVLSIFGLLFGGTALATGWRLAAAIWGAAIVLSAWLIIGLMLVEGAFT